MSEALKIALTIKAADLASDVVRRFDQRVSQSTKQIRDEWSRTKDHVAGAVKGIGVSMMVLNTIKPGVSAAASMQEAMLDVKVNLAGSVKDARELDKALGTVKSTAISVSNNMSFSAEDVVGIQGDLLKAGISLKDVAGESGAAFAVAALSDLEKQLPEVISGGMVSLDASFGGLGDKFASTADWIARISDVTSASATSLLSQSTMAASAAQQRGISAKDTITALGVLAPLGDQSGTALNAMIADLGDPKKAKFAWQGGKFVGLEESMSRLQKIMAGLPSDQARAVKLAQIFNERSLRAAGLWLDSKKSFEDINREAEQTIGLVERLDIKGQGLNVTMRKLGGTWKTAIGQMFTPLMDHVMTPIANKANKLAGWVGNKTTENPWVANSISGIAGGAMAAGGIYALVKTFQAAGSFRRVLGGLSGIAQGKAIEAMTGVTPVFVTNWPGSSGVGGAAETAAAAAAGSGAGRLSSILKGAAGGLFSPLGLAASAALIGGGTGIKALWDVGRGNDASNWASGIAHTDNGLGAAIYDFFHSDKAKFGGDMHITIDADGLARVKEMNPRGNTNMSVSTGRYMPGAG